METLNYIYNNVGHHITDSLVFKSNMNAEAEIEKIFEKHLKDACFLHFDKSEMNKTIHSISLYILGLYLLEKGWNKTIYDFNVVLDDFNFSTFNEISLPAEFRNINYIWSLASLYHDVATYKEKQNLCKNMNILDNPFLTPATFINFSELFGKERIRYNIFENYPEIQEIIDGKKIPTKENSCTAIDTISYNENIVNGYFRMRLFDGSIDHGIISGFIFYDLTVKSYLEKLSQKQHKDQNQKRNSEFEIQKDGISLKYRPQHLLLFKYIADAIIAHNIWRYDETNSMEKYTYTRFGIACDEMKSGKNRLSPKNHPLAFFLSLTDTFEPSKFFHSIPIDDVFTGVKMETSANCIKLEVTNDFYTKVCELHSDYESAKKWFKKIKSMEQWLMVKVETDYKVNCTITVED